MTVITGNTQIKAIEVVNFYKCILYYILLNKGMKIDSKPK